MPKKTVTFNSIVRVMLIHTRYEYIFCEIHNDIWWSQEELFEMKKQAFLHAQQKMKENPEKSLEYCFKHMMDDFPGLTSPVSKRNNIFDLL
jgi:hypothetical protein